MTNAGTPLASAIPEPGRSIGEITNRQPLKECLPRVKLTDCLRPKRRKTPIVNQRTNKTLAAR
jgi:hypothetical protein